MRSVVSCSTLPAPSSRPMPVTERPGGCIPPSVQLLRGWGTGSTVVKKRLPCLSVRLYQGPGKVTPDLLVHLVEF